MTNKRIEYRLRPVTRYVVTRWEGSEDGNVAGGASSQHGEYDNADVAYEVAYALCKMEHDKLGYPPGDERVQYPVNPATQQAQSLPPAGSVLGRQADVQFGQWRPDDLGNRTAGL